MKLVLCAALLGPALVNTVALPDRAAEPLKSCPTEGPVSKNCLREVEAGRSYDLLAGIRAFDEHYDQDNRPRDPRRTFTRTEGRAMAPGLALTWQGRLARYMFFELVVDQVTFERGPALRWQEAEWIPFTARVRHRYVTTDKQRVTRVSGRFRAAAIKDLRHLSLSNADRVHRAFKGALRIDESEGDPIDRFVLEDIAGPATLAQIYFDFMLPGE